MQSARVSLCFFFHSSSFSSFLFGVSFGVISEALSWKTLQWGAEKKRENIRIDKWAHFYDIKSIDKVYFFITFWMCSTEFELILAENCMYLCQSFIWFYDGAGAIQANYILKTKISRIGTCFSIEWYLVWKNVRRI